MPQFIFVEGDMSNKELSDTLIKFTQLMMTKAHVINNHFVVYDNQANMG